MEFIWAALGAFFGALFGPFVKEFLSNWYKHITKKEERIDNDVKEFESLVFEIRDLAVEHWSNTEKSVGAKTRKAGIIGRSTVLAMIIADIFENKNELKYECDMALIKFRQSVTGDEFGNLSREKMPERATQIQISVYTLIRCLKRHRMKLPHKFM